ncbi:MAG TPA: tetratricopeptide repeat protein [Saprospiraceae bacterium]|nr:tetratricopeptide repeat protein [Saprospiraceae bacterium]HMQ83024.1 tetratricopeptide repeat protein [Saprospiraceae bacterium]
MKLNTLLFPVLWLLTIQISWAQTPVVDSLKIVFAQTTDDSIKWLCGVEIAANLYLNNTDSALFWATEGYRYAQKMQNSRLEAIALSTTGVVYYYRGDFDKAFEYYFQALETAEKGGHSKSVSTILGNIGMLYGERKEHKRALDYLLKALEHKKELRDSFGIARNLVNIGMTYFNRDMLDSALYFYEQQIAICEQINEPFGKAIGLNNLGQIYMNKGQYEKALDYYQQSLAIKESLGNKNGMSITLSGIGELYLKQGVPRQAIAPLEASLRLAKESNSLPQLVTPYELLTEAYAKTGNYAKAFEYQSALLTTKDSLNRKEMLDRAESLEAQYRTEQQKVQLAEQQLEIERQTNLRNRMLIIAIVAFLIMAVLFQYYRNRQQIKQKGIEMAAQLEHAEAEKWREINQMQSTFFANISHEFRTPLTLLIGPLERMIQGDFLGDLSKYYRIMHRNARRLLDLVNQLLELSKLESGKLELHVAQADLSKLVSAIAWSFESWADRQQVSLEVQLPHKPMLVYFDRDKVEKILANLLSNAFKFTGEKGLVRVLLSQEGNHALVSVQDNGIGIAADQLPHLFNRFFGTTRSEIQEGSGLGLALSKELAELHGGGIEVSSQEGQGSRFVAKFRVDKAFFPDKNIVQSPDEGSIIAPTPTDKAPSSSVKTAVLLPEEKPVILLAEDNRDVRQYIIDQLEGSYQIVEAENGQLGLEKAIQLLPDLIISDIMMPVMDGMALCKNLKTNEKTSHIPVVMLTARAEQADKLQGLKTGADDYLTKPFDAQELQIRVANLIEQRRKLQEYYRQTLSPFATAKIEVENMDTTFLRRVKDAIEQNMEEETFGVVELSEQINMSRSQLHRKLTALTGHSPNQIIRNMRLERAKQLLESNAGNASEVAFLCGFNSLAYFSKCFKDQYGISPSEVVAG